MMANTKGGKIPGISSAGRFAGVDIYSCDQDAISRGFDGAIASFGLGVSIKHISFTEPVIESSWGPLFHRRATVA